VVLILRLFADLTFRALKSRLAPVIDSKRTMTITTTSSEMPRLFFKTLLIHASIGSPLLAHIA
jgi:hypothetical protein